MGHYLALKSPISLPQTVICIRVGPYVVTVGVLRQPFGKLDSSRYQHAIRLGWLCYQDEIGALEVIYNPPSLAEAGAYWCKSAHIEGESIART